MRVVSLVGCSGRVKARIVRLMSINLPAACNAVARSPRSCPNSDSIVCERPHPSSAEESLGDGGSANKVINLIEKLVIVSRTCTFVFFCDM